MIVFYCKKLTNFNLDHYDLSLSKNSCTLSVNNPEIFHIQQTIVIISAKENVRIE